MIDINKVIRDHLLLNSALYTAVGGTRIYAGRNEPPSVGSKSTGGYKPSDGGAVAFRVAGGAADYADALFNVRIQAKCYAGGTTTSSTEFEAWELYRLVYDALHNTTGAEIVHGEADALGNILYEPGTDWCFVLAYFTLMVRNNE